MSTALAYSINPDLIKNRFNRFEEKKSELDSTGDKNLDILREFLYFTSHDLNNPLGQIQMLVDEIKEDKDNRFTADTKELLDLVAGYAVSAQNTLEKLLNYARSSSTSCAEERVDLHGMVEDLFSSLNLEGRFSCTYKGIKNCLRTKKVPLENVLRNLIANAMKHHDKKVGRIEVDISNAGNDRILVRVKDDGPGVPACIRDEIFRPFKGFGQSKNSGLGLALASTTVEQFGGRIEHATRYPYGSIFYFTWPATS